jgi:hypothetical protein
MWVYVPAVTLTNWISFATFGAEDEIPPSQGMPFTLDANPNRVMHLYVGVQPNGKRIINQNLVRQPLKFPFNTWFHLELIAHGIGSAGADITFYFNSTPIIHFHGLVLAGPLVAVHFGLYVGGGQPPITVYNDDILIQQLSKP